MKKTKPILIIALTLLLLNSCSSISKGLGGSKKKGSDEFLIEKKAPLVLPPSFGELPEPEKKTDKDIALVEKDILNIEKLISQKSSIDADIEKDESSGSIEKSIIEKINKKEIKKQNLEKTLEEINKIPKKKNFFQKFKEKFNDK